MPGHFCKNNRKKKKKKKLCMCSDGCLHRKSCIFVFFFKNKSFKEILCFNPFSPSGMSEVAVEYLKSLVRCNHAEVTFLLNSVVGENPLCIKSIFVPVETSILK